MTNGIVFYDPGGETQNQVLIKKHYVIFQFKGSGNALILFEKHAGEIGGLAAVFMVRKSS